MSVANQVAIIYASVNGYLDNVEIDQINKYESDLVEYLSANNQSTLDTIVKSGELDDKNKGELNKALEAFSNTFNS